MNTARHGSGSLYVEAIGEDYLGGSSKRRGPASVGRLEEDRAETLLCRATVCGADGPHGGRWGPRRT
jgi:hypothetical protein